jgi:hypothetical protein
MNPVLPTPFAFRLLDLILRPVMFFLGRGKSDSLQETHYWHCQKIDEREVDSKLSVIVKGDDNSVIATNRLLPFPAFHAPLFGGWRNYVILQVQDEVEYWHVGWVHRAVPEGSRPRSHIQRLPIASREIKVLKQPKEFLTEFFALNSSGEQLPLKVVGEGILGDLKYPGVRLF